jgi:excisionase family DNA binding protein
VTLLTVQEVASQLRVKPATVYVWVAQNKIPCRKIHGLIRFVAHEIEEWLNAFLATPARILPEKLSRNTSYGLERMIAVAKREAYTRPCGKPDQDRAKRKEERNGSV